MKWYKADEKKLETKSSAIVRWYHHGEFLRIDYMSGHYLYDWAAKNSMELDQIEWLSESPSAQVDQEGQERIERLRFLIEKAYFTVNGQWANSNQDWEQFKTKNNL